MFLNNRIIWEDDTTLIDLSDRLNNIPSGSQVIDFVAAEDVLYVGSTLPFNHRYFDVSVANSNASEVTVELWDGREWTAAVDIFDQTRDSTRAISMAQSGHLSWSLDKSESWAKRDTNDMDASGLETFNIYDLYWAKLTWSADWSGTTAIDFAGWKFAEDEDLGSLYPDLNSSDVKTQFKSGKTSWRDQHFEAAEDIIRTLKSLESLTDVNQVIRWDLYKDAGVHKLAEIIFNSHGKDAIEDRDSARKYFAEAVNQIIPLTDKNKNTRLDPNEVVPSFKVRRR